MLPVETAFKIYTGLDGKPLDGGYIYFGQPNQNPITAQVTVYWDAAGTQPAAQPLRTENGYIVRVNGGTPANVFYSTSYSQLVQDSRRRQVYYARTSDDYSIATLITNFLASLGGSGGALLIGFIAGFFGAVATTVQQKLRQIVSTFDAMTAAEIADVNSHNGTIDVTAATQTSVDGVSAGGALYAPAGKYKMVPPAANEACIFVPTNQFRLTGTGAGTLFKTAGNDDVPINVSTQIDLGNNTQVSNVQEVIIDNVKVQGSGVYEYFALAYGRGILLRGVAGAIVTNSYVSDMSMIGICSEGGAGSEIPSYVVTNNILKNNRYSAINFNGRSLNSIAANNSCSGSNGATISTAIQASGHCILNANTVYGDIINYALSGGIIWGEGPYHGVGVISAHLVKHCQFGIKSVFHGPVNISGNTVVNCRTTGGIVMVGGSIPPSLPVGSADSIVSNNLLVNNFPYDIDISTPRTLVSGNRCVYLSSVINPGSNNDPDALQVVRAEAAIHIAADFVSIIGNQIIGQTRGLIINQANFRNLCAVIGNEISGTSAGVVTIESDMVPSLMVATIPLFERHSNGGGEYVNEYWASAKCTQGFWGAGDIWHRSPPGVGLTLGEVCVGVVSSSTVAVQANAGDVTVTLSSTASIIAATGNIIGIELDNHQYHWTSVTLVASPVITIAAAIPVGRTANVGGRVYWQQWAPLAVL